MGLVVNYAVKRGSESCEVTQAFDVALVTFTCKITLISAKTAGHCVEVSQDDGV